MHRPFTVDDFPRLSSDHSVQTDALYDIPHLRLRGPSPLSLFHAFNDPLTDKRMHWFGSYYRLDDESESKCLLFPLTFLVLLFITSSSIFNSKSAHFSFINYQFCSHC